MEMIMEIKEKAGELVRIQFPNDALDIGWIITNRLEDLIAEFGEDQIKKYCIGFPVHALAYGLNWQMDNLILTYGKENVEKGLKFFYNDQTIKREVA